MNKVSTLRYAAAWIAVAVLLAGWVGVVIATNPPILVNVTAGFALGYFVFGRVFRAIAYGRVR